MIALDRRYVPYVNTRYRRSGTLWDSRYKSQRRRFAARTGDVTVMLARPKNSTLARFVFALCIACFASTPARSAPVDFARVSVSVTSPVPQDALDVCSAALTVVTFFRELGLNKAMPLVVSIVTSMPEDFGPSTLGCFAPDSRRVRMLTFEAARDRGTWLGRPMDRALYRSLAAHEIAHALAWCNTSDGPLSVRAREYFAYVVMFQTMDAQHKQAILEDTPGLGFENEREISDTYFYIAPSRFGVEAYRHYIRPENGPRFLRQILRGAALPVLED